MQDSLDAPEHCPQCGSTNLSLVRKDYNAGCGCLGLLLFGWIGLLLGLLGMGDYEMICRHCGTRWPVGKPHHATQGGCGCIGSLLIIFIILALL